jgi:large subunit ribosomal protein L10
MVRLAEMPPLPVMRARLLGLLNTPATRLASILVTPARQMASVVKAYADKPAQAAA